MNERIKELMEQARHWAHFEGLEQNPRSSPDILFEQKFAELIVKECAEVASDYDGAHYVGTAIEKHFGLQD